MAMDVGGDWYDSIEFLHSEKALPWLGRQAPIPVHGSARLSLEEEMRRFMEAQPGEARGLVFDGVSFLVHDGKAKRGCRPIYAKGLHLAEDEALRHIVAVGKTGSGKSTRFVNPATKSAIEHPEASVVILCAKADQLRVTHGLARASGKRVRVLNLSNPLRSAAWNAAAYVNSEGDAIRLAQTLCQSIADPRREDSPFWIENSIQIIAGIIEAEARLEGREPTLPRVREILSLPLAEFGEYCKKHSEVRTLENFATFLRSGSTNADTILSDTRMRMRVYDDQDLAAVTSRHEIDFDELFEDEPTILIVEMDEVRIPMHRPTWNLFLGGLFDRAIEVADQQLGGRLARPLYVVIDEFASSIGRIPDFDVRLNTLRSRRVGVIAAVQSLGQVERIYGDGTPGILAGFSTKIFLAALERADAEYASKLAGTTTVQTTIRRTIRDQDGRKTGESLETTNVARPLLTPEDIDTPPEHFELGRPATIFLPGMRPVLAWLPPSWRMPACIDAVRNTPALPPDKSRAGGPLPAPRASTWRTRPSEEVLAPLDAMVRSYADRQPAKVSVLQLCLPGEGSCDGASAAKRFARERLGVARTGAEGRKRWSAFLRWSKRNPVGAMRLLADLLAFRMSWTEFMQAYERDPTPKWRRTFEIAVLAREHEGFESDVRDEVP